MARILVVEDDALQLEMRKQILEHAGHEVVAAQNASAVSYTHLDVYKRQGHRHLRQGRAERAGGRRHSNR